MPIRIVLADDHPIVLEGLAQLFATEPDCEVVARVIDGEQAMQAVRAHRPDILVLDLRMPIKDGLTVLRAIRNEGLPTQVVVLTAVSSGDLFEAIRLGARGVVLKDMAPKLLLRAVREVQAGHKWIEKDTATQAMDRLLERERIQKQAGHMLTPRELEVARLTAKGYPNKIVGEMLSITEGTVKLHLHHIYEKLGLEGRMSLSHYFRGMDTL